MRIQITPFFYSKKDLFLHALFFTLYGVVKYIPSPIGDYLRYGVLKLFVKEINSSKIAEGVTIRYPYNLSIGRDVSLNEWVFIDAPGGLKIDNGVRIAHRASLITSTHNHARMDVPIYKQGLSAGRIVICEDVWIGCNAVILPGVTINKHSIIGANSVVKDDVPAYSIAVGSPARVISRKKNRA